MAQEDQVEEGVLRWRISCNAQQVARAYSKHLLERLANMAEIDSVDDDDCKLPHLQWMCQQIVDAQDWSDTKMHRWIGYVQGVLIARKYSTVQTERDDYRRVKQETLDKLKQKDEQGI